jgi:hypothetical protein
MATPADMPGAQDAPKPQPEQQPPQSAPASDSGNRPLSFTSDEDFDATKARDLITTLRAKEREYEKYRKDTEPIVAEYENLRRASQTENERLQEDYKQLTERESHWRANALRSEAKAMAAGRFRDTETVLALIGDMSDYAADDSIDVNKLQVKLDQLAESKPFLLAEQPPEGFRPNRGQGQSATGPITPAQIAANAEAQGDWKSAGRTKAQQLVDMRKRI